MKFNRLVLAYAGLGLFATVASAQSLVVDSSYNQSAGVIEWTVSVQQASADGSSLAVELPFTLAELDGGNGFASTLASGSGANGAADGNWYYNESAAGSGVLYWNTQQNAGDLEQNPGNNPFTGTVTEGLQVDAAGKTVFASLGSDVNLPDPVPTLHIASSDGTLAWANAILAENGAQVTVSGSANSATVGDMNGDGSVNFGDLAAFVSGLTNSGYEAEFPGLDRVFRGDANGDSGFNFGDLSGFVGILTGGGAAAGSASVPEPTALMLLLAGACSLLGLRRR